MYRKLMVVAALIAAFMFIGNNSWVRAASAADSSKVKTQMQNNSGNDRSPKTKKTKKRVKKHVVRRRHRRIKAVR